MAIDKDLMWEKLDQLWRDPAVSTYPTINSRYAIISDTHLGDGKGADDFIQNKNALITALEHYYQTGFSIILLGDIEELWQFDLQDIVKTYNKDVYARLRAFGRKRLTRIFGNHDLEWGGLVDPTRAISSQRTFAPEAIKLSDGKGKVRILLVHGHQGSLDADKFTWFSRFWVRLYGGVEPILKYTGLFRASSATKSQVAKDYERTLYTWAKRNKTILICGHSHRAIFASRSYGEKIQDQITDLQVKSQTRGIRSVQKIQYLREIDQLQRELEDEKEKGRLIEPVEKDQKPLPCYFNSGCGLYSDGMTVIEIEDDDIRLVKWNKYQHNVASREVFDEGKISALLAELS
jgi:UDP-2,3-diacylglucosamine pyrophosphatase LpxH